MQAHQILPLPNTQDPLPPESIANDLLDIFPSFTGPQRSYLIERATCPSLAEAARRTGVQENTVYGWRSYVEGFRKAEAALLALKGDSTTQLARAIYKAAMPGVAVRQVTMALADEEGLSDRALIAQQRARDAVTHGAGMEGSLAPGEERLEIIAMRLWRRA